MALNLPRVLYLVAGVLFIIAALAAWGAVSWNPIGLIAVGLAAMAFAPLVG